MELVVTTFRHYSSVYTFSLAAYINKCICASIDMITQRDREKPRELPTDRYIKGKTLKESFKNREKKK